MGLYMAWLKSLFDIVLKVFLIYDQIDINYIHNSTISQLFYNTDCGPSQSCLGLLTRTLEWLSGILEWMSGSFPSFATDLLRRRASHFTFSVPIFSPFISLIYLDASLFTAWTVFQCASVTCPAQRSWLYVLGGFVGATESQILK